MQACGFRTANRKELPAGRKLFDAIAFHGFVLLLPNRFHGPDRGKTETAPVYSRLPYIATASSTEISPFPTRNAAARVCTATVSIIPSISGEMIRLEGT